MTVLTSTANAIERFSRNHNVPPAGRPVATP